VTFTNTIVGASLPLALCTTLHCGCTSGYGGQSPDWCSD